MKLNSIVMLGILLSGATLRAYNPEVDNQTKMQILQEYLQGVQEKMFKEFHELFFEEMVEIHVKYYKEIEWLRENYWKNDCYALQGNELMNAMMDEILEIMLPKMEAYCETLFSDMPFHFEQSDLIKKQLSQQFIGQLPQLLERSFKTGMLIESHAYARYHGLQ
jgi:hypothetical protein